MSEAHRVVTGGRHTADELLATAGAAPSCASSSKETNRPSRPVGAIWALACAAFCAQLSFQLVALSVAGDELLPRRTLDELRVSAPRLHFITGRSLQRLHDGITVPFDFQLSIAAGAKNNITERALDRFVVSYDLWEEKFLVVRPRSLRKSSPRLSANAAESWCLDNLSIPISRLPADRDLWARLEIRSAETRQESPLDESGISLTTLIEVFSRPTRAQQEHWSVESAPFRLADLKQ